MLEKPNAPHTLGIDRDGPSLLCAQLAWTKGKPLLEQILEIDHVKPLDTDAPQLISKKHLTVTCLDSEEVLIRSMEIKLKKERDVDAVLAFQAEPLLPYPLENAILDRILLSQTDDGTLLTLLAARKDHVEQHLDKYHALQINPEVVSCVPAALTFFSNLVAADANPRFVVHLGHDWTTCILVKDGKLMAAQSTHANIEHLMLDSASPEFDGFQREVARLLSAISKQSKTPEMNQVLFTGKGAANGKFCEELCRKINKSAIIPVVPLGFEISITELQRFAVAIGAALSALPFAANQINFRQNELAYPHPWKRLKQPIALYFALCICLAAAFYFFGKSYIEYHEDQERQEYANLLATMNKSYPDFEKEYERKMGLANDEPRKIESLSLNEIGDRLSYLQKDLKESPDSFPLQPNIPRVSDVLAWLSTHPNVSAKDGAPLLQIDNFSYAMVKRPELKKKQEKYQIKVEIEFSAPTAKLAREFHDALIAPNDIVDPKGEVKWNANKGKYRASFFLKDKTAYP